MNTTIAVVDDDAAILDAVTLLLESCGWAVRTYASGEAFLADWRSQTLDCLILDAHLPGISGADVATKIIASGRRMPIIALTARPESAVAAAIRSSGADMMLAKPVNADILIDRVTAFVERSDSTKPL